MNPQLETAHSKGHQPHIAFITVEDASDPLAWSGSVYNMAKALEDAGATVDKFGNLQESKPTRLRTGLMKLGYAKLAGKDYFRNRDEGYLRDIAAGVKRRLGKTRYDAIISPSSIPLAHLETDAPLIFWTDATFDGMVDFYPTFSNLAPRTLRDGAQMERTALNRATCAVYTSEWALESAIKHYGAPRDKLHFIRYGANIAEVPPEAEALANAAARSPNKIRFVFVGANWERKGGPVAFAVVREMRNRGFDAVLDVIGATPPEDLPDYVIRHGFIRKDSAEGRARFNALFGEAHFHILASRAECCAVVLAEAAALAVPSLATRVGGNAAALSDGKTGYLFGLDDPAFVYCDRIIPLLQDPQQYRALCARTVRTYHETLSWQVNATAMVDLVGSLNRHSKCTKSKS